MITVTLLPLRGSLFVCCACETRLLNYHSLENVDNFNGMAKNGCNSFKLTTKNVNCTEFKWLFMQIVDTTHFSRCCDSSSSYRYHELWMNGFFFKPNDGISVLPHKLVSRVQESCITHNLNQINKVHSWQIAY